MKQIIDLRPVHHRLEDCIHAHVLLCWLALLLIRIIENTTGTTWNRLTAELGRLHAVTYTGPTGTFQQRTELTPAQHEIYTTLELSPPRRSSSSQVRTADQPQRHHLVTRPSGAQVGVPTGQTPESVY